MATEETWLWGIRRRAAEGGAAALKPLERPVAFQHGWIPGWCALCGKPWRFGQAWHFPGGGLKRACGGALTYEEPKR